MRPEILASATTLLFVPGHRPDRFGKAAAAGADAIVIDLEDAVGVDLKDAARTHLTAWLDAGHPAVVRVNGSDTEFHEADLAAIEGRRCPVMLPKVERPAQVEALVRRLGPDTMVLPLLETAAGVWNAKDVCAAAGVVRPVIGTVDLGAQLGIDHRHQDGLAVARSLVVLAAAAAGCAPPMDGVTTAVLDEQALVADADAAVRLGFTGKVCVHPRQVPAVRAAFAPSPEALAWARTVVDSADDDSVSMRDGEMIDRPVVLRARRLLARGDPAMDVGSKGIFPP